MDKNFLQAERTYLDPDNAVKAKIWGECEICGDEIFYGEEYWKIGGANVCEHCIDESRATAGE